MQKSLTPEEIIEQFDKLFASKDHVIDHYRNCQMHAKGIIYDKVLTRRLNEDADTMAWRKENYKAITQSIWQRAVNTLSRIFKSTGFNKYISDQLTEYLSYTKFHNMEIEQLLELKILPLMMEDANGYLIVLPEYEEANYSDEEKQAYLDSEEEADTYVIRRNEYNEPIIEIEYISCEKVYYKDKTNFIWTKESLYDDMNGEKTSPIMEHFKKYGEKKEKCYYWLNLYGLYEIEIVNEKEKKINTIFQYQFAAIPVQILGGVWCDDEMYYSYLNNFLPWGNEAICSFSDYQALLATASYPVKQMVQIECDAPGCNHGYVTGEHGMMNCHSCNGTGHKTNIGPFNVIEKPMKADGTLLIETDMLTYIVPPMEPITILAESWKSLLLKAEESVYLLHTDASQSGVAKTIDRDEEMAFCSRIANNLYTRVYANLLGFIEEYILGQIIKKPLIIPPTDFLVYSTDYLLEKVENTSILALKLDAYKELIDRKWSGQTSQQKIQQWNLYFNSPFFLNDTMTNNDLLAQGYMSSVAYAKNLIYYNYFNQLLMQMGEAQFNQLSLFDLDTMLTETITASMEQAPAPDDTSMIP